MNNAITWYTGPEVTAQEIEEIYTPEVMYNAQMYYAVLMYTPIIFCILTFLLWYWDHRVKRKEKQTEGKNETRKFCNKLK